MAAFILETTAADYVGIGTFKVRMVIISSQSVFVRLLKLLMALSCQS